MSLPWLNKVLLLLLTYFGGSVVEFWPATRETGVRFPASSQCAIDHASFHACNPNLRGPHAKRVDRRPVSTTRE